MLLLECVLIHALTGERRCSHTVFSHGAEAEEGSVLLYALTRMCSVTCSYYRLSSYMLLLECVLLHTETWCVAWCVFLITTLLECVLLHTELRQKSALLKNDMIESVDLRKASSLICSY